MKNDIRTKVFLKRIRTYTSHDLSPFAVVKNIVTTANLHTYLVLAMLTLSIVSFRVIGLSKPLFP